MANLNLNNILDLENAVRRNLPNYAGVELNNYAEDYTPVCPRGYTDCVVDPGYIKSHCPDWYEEMYGSQVPEEAASECRERMYSDPDEQYPCYNNGDKEESVSE